MGKLNLGPGRVNQQNTKALQGAKLYAKSNGSFQDSLLSAGFYAKKQGKTMYVFQGNSFMHSVWRVSYKASDYLSPISNTGAVVFSVDPDLTVTQYDVQRPQAEPEGEGFSLLASVTRVSERFMLRQAFGPRDFFLAPEVRGTPPLIPAGTDLAIWTWDQPDGRLRAVAFQGKADKPLFNYYFRSEAERQKTIDYAVDTRKKSLAEKLKSQQEKKEFVHNLKPGDILYSSWGYDQTNISWYQVTAAKPEGKAVVIREISANVVRSVPGTDYMMPAKGHFIGEALKKIPQLGYKGEAYIKVTSFSSAHPWDGKPKGQTASGYGH